MADAKAGFAEADAEVGVNGGAHLSNDRNDFVRTPLEGLVERCKADPGAPFENEILVALWRLEQDEPAKFARLRAALKAEGCRVSDLHRYLKGVEKAQRAGAAEAAHGDGCIGAGTGSPTTERGPLGTAADTRPILRVEPHKYSELAEEVEQAILRSGQAVYAGSNALVYPALTEVETELGVNVSVTRLIEIR